MLDWKEVFNKLNEGISEGVEEAIISGNFSFDGLDGMVDTELNKLKVLPGSRSLREYVEDTDDPEILLEAYTTAALNFDYECPDFLIEKIFSLGVPGIKEMATLALGGSWSGKPGEDGEDEISEEQIIASITLRDMAGVGEPMSHCFFNNAVDKLLRSSRPLEHFGDAFGDLALAFGKKAYDKLFRTIDEACEKNELKPAHDYLLAAIVAAEDESVREEAFDYLHMYFKGTDNKILACHFFEDMNNPRGIRVLRTYLEENRESLDEREILQIISSVKKLGGDISDLQ